MLTKEQKKVSIALATDKIKGSKSILFTDFTGVSNQDLETLKNDLRKQGATVKVFKKRLLKIALQEAGIEFDPMSNLAPLASIFSEADISEIAGSVYKYGLALKKKNNGANLTVMGAYDADQGVLTQDQFVVIAKLPSRDVLLAMVMGGITGPLRAFMSIVSQLSEGKGGADKAEEKPAEVDPAEDLPAEASAKEGEPAPEVAEPTNESNPETNNEQVES
ncbi:MAG: 50S ribosomal protein L10 [Candidatus Harrisonbacteria bacterium CG10_big_fil_rev_8_21_14_0_10_49_15]|uniref:Large ribosomal subunit protein uL10 n=1 Tax=Candidatus Harrisonbacteria bacterium CG10_big_fil_rev_8_21_14_0_10_49_15 TaxID=1974587 RepID=A0A2H0UNB6_9BACT|nr:MAG: 50S ribosomal protein L10 [Candidatus Harrisonbacteria bacterium CG10_big_fil_rev_8_21_14_0_10_49_15]